jgi:steroid delta-isomerase-like uncharacterized protein
MLDRLFGRSSDKTAEEPVTVQSSPGDVAAAFFHAIVERDLEKAFALVADDAEVTIHPVGVRGGRADVALAFFRSTLVAFPDLTLKVKRTVTTAADTVVTELKFEGTQAAEYLGVINQEKHLDVDQGWVLRVADGQIRSITGYWCQNQLYRRLAVKRIDQPAIV